LNPPGAGLVGGVGGKVLIIQNKTFKPYPETFSANTSYLACFQVAGMYNEVQEDQPLLRDAIRDAEFVEKEATWFYRDFTGMSIYA
jgi:hypothetical protein